MRVVIFIYLPALTIFKPNTPHFVNKLFLQYSIFLPADCNLIDPFVTSNFVLLAAPFILPLNSILQPEGHPLGLLLDRIRVLCFILLTSRPDFLVVIQSGKALRGPARSLFCFACNICVLRPMGRVASHCWPCEANVVCP